MGAPRSPVAALPTRVRGRLPRRASRGRARPAAPAAPEAPPPSYLELCDAARLRLTDDDPSGAEAVARDALALLPRGAEAQRLLGLALLERGEARPAIRALSAALACDPADVVAQTGVAEARELVDGPAGAEADWGRAWELDPGQPQIKARLQAARLAAGALDEAAAPPLTRAALARIYLRGGLLEHAATEARTLLAREPDRPDLQLLLAESFWKMGDSDAAAAVATALLERLPDCAAANLLVAAHWHAIGRDISAPMARVRAVDPAGDIADRLFEDREAPPLMEAEAAAAPYQRPLPPETAFAAAVEAEVAEAGEVEETQPLPAVALPKTVEPAPEEPAEEVSVPRAADEAEALAEPAALVAQVGAGQDLVEADRDEEPTAIPEPTAAAPTPREQSPRIEPVSAAVEDASDAARRVGDSAMRERRYLDALRAYGEALRAERQTS